MLVRFFIYLGVWLCLMICLFLIHIVIGSCFKLTVESVNESFFFLSAILSGILLGVIF